MNKIITCWENDLTDVPDIQVSELISKHYPNCEFKMLSGLEHRDIHDIYDSLKESNTIIIHAHIIKPEQIINIVKNISHPIHVNNCGRIPPKWEIENFVILSMHPVETYKQIKLICENIKDQHEEYALLKLLRNCQIYFRGFNNEYYEMIIEGYETINIGVKKYS